MKFKRGIWVLTLFPTQKRVKKNSGRKAYMRKKEWLMECMRSLHDLLEFYLENPFDEDTHMQLNDGLTDTFDAMHNYFME